MSRIRFPLLGTLVTLFLAASWSGPAALPAVAAAAPDHGHGLLWKIERTGRAPSYLFGTVHLADPRVTRLPEPVTRVFDAAEHFVMEILPDAEGIARLAGAMFFQDGRTLESVVGASLYDDIEKAFARRGLPRAGLERYKPWAVSLILAMPTPQGGMPLDLRLYTLANEQGKRLGSLETVKEQIEVFDGLSPDDQRALLEVIVREEHMVEARVEQLVQAWLARDLEQLRALSEQHAPEDRELHGRVMRRLLAERNRRMVERMERWLRDGNAFIAVGAAHLSGREGLLELLERDGYRVRAVY